MPARQAWVPSAPVRAAEPIHELGAVLYYRGTAQDVVAMPHYHPTLSEAWTFPAQRACGRRRLGRPSPRDWPFLLGSTRFRDRLHRAGHVFLAGFGHHVGQRDDAHQLLVAAQNRQAADLLFLHELLGFL